MSEKLDFQCYYLNKQVQDLIKEICEIQNLLIATNYKNEKLSHEQIMALAEVSSDSIEKQDLYSFLISIDRDIFALYFNKKFEDIDTNLQHIKLLQRNEVKSILESNTDNFLLETNKKLIDEMKQFINLMYQNGLNGLNLFFTYGDFKFLSFCIEDFNDEDKIFLGLELEIDQNSTDGDFSSQHSSVSIAGTILEEYSSSI